MPDQLQLRGGTTTEHATFTGASKEVTIDTTKKTAVVHDASTAGGNPLMREDGANSALINGSVTEPALAFAAGDADNGIYSPGADQVAITTNGVERVEWGASEVVFNDGGENYDFRINGDNTNSLFFVDASTDRIGVGTASPSSILHARSSNALFRLESTSNTSAGVIQFGDPDDIDVGSIRYEHSDNALRLITNAGTGEVRIDSSGRLLVGTGTTTGDQGDADLLIQGSTQGELYLSRGSTPLNNGGGLGFIVFTGGNGADSAAIRSYSDGGTWTNGSSHPSRIVFSTTADGASTPTERMRITSAGQVGIGKTSSFAYQLEVEAGNTSLLRLNNNTETGHGSHDVRIVAGGTYYQNLQFRASSVQFNTYDGSTISERARIDSDGRLLIGTASDITGSTAYQLQIVRNGAANLVLGSSDTTQPSAGTSLGQIGFYSNAGSTWGLAGRITCQTDGASGSGDNPGRLVFSTTADGGSSPVERMRIQADARIKMTQPAENINALYVASTNASYTSSVLELQSARNHVSSWSFGKFYSSGGSDVEFNLRGDGIGFADQSWNGGGADYAEYFEWSDGNTTAEDRRGISVVLDGDKIREAVAGEEPIGVISGNPSVVGDSDIERWKGKYLRDDYGTYIQEDYEVENDDGNTVIQQRPKLNPDYNPDTEYVSREDRPEWDCVGLMGKLRIRKGQVTGARWIKMRDVSDNVEEWLVR